MIVSLTSNEANSAGLRFQISDPSGNVILNSRHYKGEVFSLATGHGASKGLYTVKIYVVDSGEDWAGVDYELFWLYHEAAAEPDMIRIFMEFEPNDTPEYANYIPIFSTYISSISTSSDVDYYSFTLTARSRFSAVIYVADFEKSVLNAEIFDSDNKSVGKLSFSDYYEYIDTRLSAGTYYIKVTTKNAAVSWDNDPYFISIAIET